MRRILVLGGGTAGTLAANLLARELGTEIKRGDVEITLLDEDGNHVFQPNLLYTSFKGMKPDKIVRPEKKLLHKRINFSIDRVTKINFTNNRVITETNKTYTYDDLIIAVGSKIARDEIPGFDETNLDFHSSQENAWKVWERIQEIRKGKVVVGVSAFPHKCPPAPIEATFLLEEFFKKRKLKDNVEIHFITPISRPYPDPTISNTIEHHFKEREIIIHPFFNIDRVDSEKKKIYSLEGTDLEFEAMFVVPPHKAPQAIIDSKIGDEDGWIPTDKYTLLVNGQENVYAIGDVADLRTSKSGVTAHLEAVVVARNIISDIRQTGERCKFTGRTHCPMDVGYGKALFVISSYSKAAKDVKPTRRNMLMKKAFAKMYWTAVGGSLEWLFDRYFGVDARECFIEESI